MTGVGRGAETTYPSVIPEFILVFSEVRVAVSSAHDTIKYSMTC